MTWHPEILTTADDRRQTGLVLLAVAIVVGVILGFGMRSAFASIGDNADRQAASRSQGQAVSHHRVKPRVAVRKRPVQTVKRKSSGGGVSLAGVVPTLADKAREIVSACGGVVVSAISSRPNRSNHGIGRAVDISNNPKCIYAHLAGWKGGYSTDYSTVRCDGGRLCPHVHISWNPGGMEWGVRFVHRDPFGNGKVRRTRLAHAMVR